VVPCAAERVVVAPGVVAACALEVTLPVDAAVTTPYFLRAPRDGAMYRWEGSRTDWGEPFEAAPLQARVTLTPEGGRPIVQTRDVVHRYRDQAIGEVRRPVLVVPRVDVKLDPAAKVWPTGARAAQTFMVTLQHGSSTPTAGTVALELPAGWPPVPAQRFSLSREEERESLVFQVRPPEAMTTGTHEIRAVARDSAGRRYTGGLATVDYPHIRPRTLTRDAVSTIHAAPIARPAVTHVGYIRGASDRVPEALLGIGLPVDLLDGVALERGNLAQYDVIVVGSRAYETDPALRENNARLLEYVRNGGRLVVQYQQNQFFNGNYAPAPLQLANRHDRVTDENAPVALLHPESPLFLRPNRLGASDWTGWIQERGLYFAQSWDRSYQPLLEMADPGEAALRGGLLVSAVGRGTYVYTGLSFFRQLPAGVPGAYRLFLNLLDLRATPPQP
jgi:hypothetical protein